MRNADGIETALYDGVARTPRMRVEEACAWIAEDYPRKWLRLVSLCEQAKADGLPRIRRGDLYVLATQQGMPITLCREFRFDNNLWSILSRYLLMFRPELAAAIFPKATKALDDGIDFEEVWHGTVARNTFFPCRCWQDAERLYREAA